MFRFLLFCLSAFSILVQPALAQERVFEFTYNILPTELPDDQAVDIYIPVPAEQVGQRILGERVAAAFPLKRGSETTHGNTFYHLHRPAGEDGAIAAELSWTVARSLVTTGGANEAEAARAAGYLGENRLVPVGHEVLDPILAEIRASRVSDSSADTARAIYDWVVDNVEYKKVGTGWGNGDTFWACSERYGNCTDFHALFVSLARTENIPARFEIGFPVPDSQESGTIGGYHCWVQFYLPGEGWVPIDASEAAKAPQHKELYYGTHPADRIHFTTGRDLVVSKHSAREPLNYFVYPYVEVGGKPWAGKLETRFTYAALAVENPDKP
ncbi:MAG: transglutaminase domain-containing protein [Halioglobus sp.]|nr:transglutaminase domain-containing protein [Halioglobus sp.]